MVSGASEPPQKYLMVAFTFVLTFSHLEYVSPPLFFDFFKLWIEVI